MHTLLPKALATLVALLLLLAGPFQFSDHPAPAIAAPTPSPSPTPALGADLGVPAAFALAGTASQCGAGFVTQSEVLKCPTAIANHQLVFVWQFDQNGCAKKPCVAPDGFNIVRRANGAANVFQTVSGADHGAILQVTGDDVIGSCFSALAYHGKDDFGRASPEVCIDEVDHLVLKATRVGSAHSYSDDNGSSCKSPTSNPVGYNLVYKSGDTSGLLYAGYLTRSGGTSVLGVLANPVDTLAQAIAIGEAVANGGDGTCNHYRDVYQGLFYFDLTPVAAAVAKGKKVQKATLALGVAAGAWNAGSPSGGDGTEHASAPAPNCAATIGFPRNVNVGSDISFPNTILFDTFANVNGGVGMLNADLTGMVHAWLNPGGVNRGVVLTPSYHDPTHPPAAGGKTVYNADCMSKYGTPELAVTLTSQ